MKINDGRSHGKAVRFVSDIKQTFYWLIKLIEMKINEKSVRRHNSTVRHLLLCNFGIRRNNRLRGDIGNRKIRLRCINWLSLRTNEHPFCGQNIQWWPQLPDWPKYSIVQVYMFTQNDEIEYLWYWMEYNDDRNAHMTSSSSYLHAYVTAIKLHL